MDADEARARFAQARVARLATVAADGRPHLVPIVFAVDGDTVLTAVDHKPKSTRALKRLANIAARPEVAVLVDRYDDDWSRLWWVRADGSARIVDGAAAEVALDRLAERYVDYRRRRPPGPVVAITVELWSGWSAAPGSATSS
jgi:PPOX class probable F420-dependent enzyme